MESFKTKILPAILAGGALVAVAYYAEQKRPDTAAAVSSVEVTRKHIPVEDTNQDGVPDWQAQVINSDPIYIDGEADKSDTLTKRLSREILDDPNIRPESDFYDILKDDFAREYIDRLIDETEEPIYTTADLRNIIETTDKDALHSYGNLVGSIIYHHDSKNQIKEKVIYNRYVRDKNPKHLEDLATVEATYNDIIEDLLELETPQQYVSQHLAIINGFSALKHDVYAMQLYLEDPVYATMRVGQYDHDVLSVSSAIVNLYDALYLKENITFGPNDSLRFWADNLR